MAAILPPDFFLRPVLAVSRDMLGKYLVREISGKTSLFSITEVEAYDGVRDRACHASKGRTARNEVMFGPPGHFYVYFCYGVHWMLNVVTGPEDHPAAVLIRGTGEISGPGRLTRALGIDKSLNGAPAIPASGLWFEDHGPRRKGCRIIRTPRIGVDYAGPFWANKPWRFLLAKGAST